MTEEEKEEFKKVITYLTDDEFKVFMFDFAHEYWYMPNEHKRIEIMRKMDRAFRARGFKDWFQERGLDR